MKKKRVVKSIKKPIDFQQDSNSDLIWALITVFSLPIIAMSLMSFGYSAVISFILALIGTFLIIVIEALIRGKVWFFQGRYRKIFEHPETPFKILVLTGGALLFLQTFFILYFITSPASDSALLNFVIQRECRGSATPLNKMICPLFETVDYTSKNNFKLIYSLDKASQAHLLPNSVFAICAVIPRTKYSLQDSEVDIRFLAHCQNKNNKITKLIQATFKKQDDGFYKPLVWQEVQDKNLLNNLINNSEITRQLQSKILKRKKFSDVFF